MKRKAEEVLLGTRTKKPKSEGLTFRIQDLIPDLFFEIFKHGTSFEFVGFCLASKWSYNVFFNNTQELILWPNIESEKLNKYTKKFKQSKLRKLTSLYNSFDNTLASHVATFTNLQSLVLFGCNDLHNEGFMCFSALQNLTKIFIDNCKRITDVSTISKLLRLEDIYFRLKTLNPVLMHCSNLTNLTRLSVVNQKNLASDVEFKILENLIHLEDLFLGVFSGVNPENFAYFRHLTKLRDLGIGHMDMNTPHIKHLSTLTSLRSLKLIGYQLSDESMEIITANLQNLQSLFLHSPELRDQFLIPLKTLQNLKVLELSKCSGLTDAGMIHIKNLTNLESILLWGVNSLTDNGFKNIITLQKLSHVTLKECSSITDDGIRALIELPSLEKVILYKLPNITYTGIEPFAKNKKTLVIKGCPNITKSDREKITKFYTNESGDSVRWWGLCNIL